MSCRGRRERAEAAPCCWVKPETCSAFGWTGGGQLGYASKWMEPTDITVRILQDIREDIRGMRSEQLSFREELRLLREEQREFREQAFARFEVIETTLRDLAEQLVMLARGTKVAIEERGKTEERFREIERRIDQVERRLPPSGPN